MRISDWSSDVCSSDLTTGHVIPGPPVGQQGRKEQDRLTARQASGMNTDPRTISAIDCPMSPHSLHPACGVILAIKRSEEHTSELQSLMRISYAVFCLKKTKNTTINSQSRPYQNYAVHI